MVAMLVASVDPMKLPRSRMRRIQGVWHSVMFGERRRTFWLGIADIAFMDADES